MSSTWVPGRDRRAVRHPAGPGASRSTGTPRRVVVAGGGIAGLAAAVGLAERGVQVTLVEKHDQLGGRVRSWPVESDDGEPVTMSRGFHAFFRQYYNLRSLLRRVDPDLAGLTGITDYPLEMAGGRRDSFAGIPRTPPLNLAAFVAVSPSFRLRDLARVNVSAALELLDVDFPSTFGKYDGESAAQFLDRLRFPDGARHLALEVFARSFFADPEEFSAGELVGMFHTYFVGSSEGLLFDVPVDDYDAVFWAPLGRYLQELGVQVLTGSRVESVDLSADRVVSVRIGHHGVTADLVADAVVLATDPAATRHLVADASGLGDWQWRRRVAETSSAPRFAVLRFWFDRLVNPERPAFLGTSGYGLLDNVTVLERFERGAAKWSCANRGSVVELHAYALPENADDVAMQASLRAQLGLVYPETVEAQVVSSQWLVNDDCPLITTSAWADRPGVATPDSRLLLAGDGIRCDLPVALMERAATTGWLAANTLLEGWGLAGHELWTVPMKGRIAAIGKIRRLFSPDIPHVAAVDSGARHR